MSIKRIFLDTNIYIIGVSNVNSFEYKILDSLGFYEKNNSIEVVVSQPLFEQILRVAKRLRHKDWGSEIIDQIWQNFNVIYVLIENDECIEENKLGLIPREDISIYLTAKNGKADCFVSANYKLIKALVEKTGEFECLTPEAFVKKYL